eukprot:TRINITY_DN11706_c0_g1_i1.p1 TRINITY_DN11706_c0_g1~~TRINITY_DN11706_c0_g1_i1.p1  ORF type:complete len:233 (+),score=45.33 TRINITY_DN11706_c0_g1_i1:76-699(+)
MSGSPGRARPGTPSLSRIPSAYSIGDSQRSRTGGLRSVLRPSSDAGSPVGMRKTVSFADVSEPDRPPGARLRSPGPPTGLMPLLPLPPQQLSLGCGESQASERLASISSSGSDGTTVGGTESSTPRATAARRQSSGGRPPIAPRQLTAAQFMHMFKGTITQMQTELRESRAVPLGTPEQRANQRDAPAAGTSQVGALRYIRTGGRQA